MVDQITFQTISIVIAATTVVIGVINSIISNRREEKQRQEQLILQRFQSYGLEYMSSFQEVLSTLDWKDAEEFNQKYSRNVNPEFNSKWLYIIQTYNLVGIMLKRGADPNLIFQLYPEGAVLRLWELYEPLIKRRREFANNPLYLEPLEYLYKDAKKRHPEIRPGRFD